MKDIIIKLQVYELDHPKTNEYFFQILKKILDEENIGIRAFDGFGQVLIDFESKDLDIEKDFYLDIDFSNEKYECIKLRKKNSEVYWNYKNCFISKSEKITIIITTKSEIKEENIKFIKNLGKLSDPVIELFSDMFMGNFHKNRLLELVKKLMEYYISMNLLELKENYLIILRRIFKSNMFAFNNDSSFLGVKSFGEKVDVQIDNDLQNYYHLRFPNDQQFDVIRPYHYKIKDNYQKIKNNLLNFQSFINLVQNFENNNPENTAKNILFVLDQKKNIVFLNRELPMNMKLENNESNTNIINSENIFGSDSNELINKIMIECDETKEYSNVYHWKKNFDLKGLMKSCFISGTKYYGIHLQTKKMILTKRTSYFEEKIDVQKIEKYLFSILSSYNIKTNLTVDEIINLIKSTSKEEDLKEKLSNVEFMNSVLSEYYPPVLIAKKESFRRTAIKQRTMAPRKSIQSLEKPAPFKKALTEKSLSLKSKSRGSTSNSKENNLIPVDTIQKEEKILNFIIDGSNMVIQKEKLLNWEFDILEIHKPEDKCYISWNMIELMKFNDITEINKEIFTDFISVVYSKYSHNENPYHNFDHAITVQHSVFWLLKNKKDICCILEELDIFSLIISGLVHDIDHTGKNNAFENSSLSKLSIRYNDLSVLENHHCATFFKIIRDPRYNIFENLDREDYLYCRSLIINCILSTDMKCHFELCKKFEVKLNEFKENKDAFDNLENKKLLLGMMIHSCDIYGPTKPNEIALKWNEKINKEFSKQVQAEEYLQLPVTFFMKDLDNMQIRAKQEFNFIKVIVLPVWELLNKYYDGDLDELVKNCNDNQSYWEKKLIEISEQ